jgi:hypothetical protein
LRRPSGRNDDIVPPIEEAFHRIDERDRGGKIRPDQENPFAAREQNPMARRVSAPDGTGIAQQEDAGPRAREIDHLLARLAAAPIVDDQDLPPLARPREEVRMDQLEGLPDRSSLIPHGENDAQADAIAGHAIPWIHRVVDRATIC